MQEVVYKIPSLCEKYTPHEYGITKSGRVWKFPCVNAEGRKFGGRWLQIGTIGKGYKTVGLQSTQYGVHRLLAEVFIRRPEGRNYRVIHKDGNVSNNDVSNLEWQTQSELMQKSWDEGKMERNRKANKERKERKRALYVRAEEEIKQEILQEVKQKIDFSTRAGQMIHLIFEERLSLADLGIKYGISRERARQLVSSECERCGLDYGLIKQVRPLKKHVNYKNSVGKV